MIEEIKVEAIEVLVEEHEEEMVREEVEETTNKNN